MGFDADTHKSMERFQKWSNSNAILDKDYSAVLDLFNRHDSERTKLFEELLNHLKREKDVVSPWQSTADKGVELNDALNKAIAEKVPDGLRGLGMSDFYEGEKKAWQSIKGSLIAPLSEIMSEIAMNDVELAKTFEDELKKAREEGRVIDEAARATLGENRDTVRGMAIDAAKEGATKVISEVPMIGKHLVGVATKLVESLMGGSAKVREFGRKKRAIKDTMLLNRDKMDKLREALSEKAIEASSKNAYDLAGSWRGNAGNGDYGANDWESFGSACKDIIRNKADPAMDKAKKLYGEVYPAYLEAIKKDFVTLLSDPSTLDSFKGQLSDDAAKLFDELTADDQLILALRDSDPKRTAAAEMAKIRDDVTNAIKTLKDSIREIEELMKT
jgi:hypothetical protein